MYVIAGGAPPRRYAGHEHADNDDFYIDGPYGRPDPDDVSSDDEDAVRGQCDATTLSVLRLVAGDRLRLNYDYGHARSLTLTVSEETTSPENADAESTGRNANADGATAAARYLGIVQGPPGGVLLTEAERLESATRRAKLERYMKGDNLWSWHQCQYIKPMAPVWSFNEERAVYLLIVELDMPFGAAWSQYLEPCLVLRNKTAASAKWYSSKKSLTGRSASMARGRASQALKEALRAAREEHFLFPCEKQPPVLSSDHRYSLERRMVQQAGDGVGEAAYKQVRGTLKAMSMQEKVAKFFELCPEWVQNARRRAR